MSRLPPKVTGLSPKEGPAGTRIIIRGEHLGISPKDLISINVCGAECIFQAEWQNPSKILCRSGNGIGLGDVVVTTKSGGTGTCTVQFRGYMDSVGPTKESAVWVDDSRFDAGVKNQNQPTTSLLESEDPLALSDEQGICIFTEDELIEKFPEGSGNIAQENFVPAWYLLENHSGASFEDLRQGLRHMQSQVRHQSTGPVLFLKAHLGSYFECIDTLDNLQVRLTEDSSRFLEDASGLISKVSGARELTDKTFEVIFKRRKKVEFYHSCINTIQRFRYLFNLLSSANKHIKNRQYRAITDDYKKLQQVLGRSSSSVLQDAFKDIESKMELLRTELREELKVVPGTAVNQLHICRSLAELGNDSSSARWDLANNLHKFMKGKILDAYSSCFFDDRAAKDRLLAVARSGDYPQLKFRVKFSPKSDTETIAESSVPKDVTSTPNGRQPSKATDLTYLHDLIKLVTETMVARLEHFWRICESFGDVKEHSGRSAGREEREWIRLQREMSQEAAGIYVAIVRTVFGPKDILITPEEFYTVISCIHDVRMAFYGHTEEWNLLGNLVIEMKRTFVLSALNRGVIELESIMASGKDQPDITLRLSAKFPEIFTMIAIKTVRVTKPCIVDDPRYHGSIMNEPGIIEDIMVRWTRFIVSPVATFRHFAESGTSVVVLFSLMSMHSMVNKILPRIFGMLRNLLPNVPAKFSTSIIELYTELLVDLRKSFIEMKSEPIMGAIEKMMSDYAVDWKMSEEPTGVNVYITQIALDLNIAHEELTVFASETGLVDELMCGIVEKVTEELNRLFVVTIKFSPNGAFQGQLDVAAYRLVIGKFRTQETRKLLAELDTLLLKSHNPVKKSFDQLFNSFRKENQMLFFAL